MPSSAHEAFWYLKRALYAAGHDGSDVALRRMTPWDAACALSVGARFISGDGHSASSAEAYDLVRLRLEADEAGVAVPVGTGPEDIPRLRREIAAAKAAKV